MPILNKKKQHKAEQKRPKAAALPLPLPEPVETCDVDCRCSHQMTAEAPEILAARQERYAAEGRTQSGVLIQSQSQSYSLAPVDRWTDAECQAVVDIFGPEHGAELILIKNEDWSLDDVYGLEMEEAWDAWRSAFRANQAERDAKEKAEIDERWRRCVVQQAVVEARRALKRNEHVQKNGRLCTRLYSCVGNKHTGGAKPSTLHVSSECFTHQAFLAGTIKDDCPFAHPGDSTWHPEWLTNYNWKPAVVPTAPEQVRVFAGGSAAQRFAALARPQKNKS